MCYNKSKIRCNIISVFNTIRFHTAKKYLNKVIKNVKTILKMLQ